MPVEKYFVFCCMYYVFNKLWMLGKFHFSIQERMEKACFWPFKNVPFMWRKPESASWGMWLDVKCSMWPSSLRPGCPTVCKVQFSITMTQWHVTVMWQWVRKEGRGLRRLYNHVDLLLKKQTKKQRCFLSILHHFSGLSLLLGWDKLMTCGRMKILYLMDKEGAAVLCQTMCVCVVVCVCGILALCCVFSQMSCLNPVSYGELPPNVMGLWG